MRRHDYATYVFLAPCLASKRGLPLNARYVENYRYYEIMDGARRSIMKSTKWASLSASPLVHAVEQRIRLVLPRGGFARSVAVLAGGTTLAQVISILVSPALTRLYTPEDFGALAVYISILSMLLVVASWSYELAIALPEETES